MIAEKRDAEQWQQSRISEVEMPNGTNARMCGMYASGSGDSRSIGVGRQGDGVGLEVEIEVLGVGYLIRWIQFASTR